MARRFARLKPGAPPYPPGFEGVPSDGMCLGAFLIVCNPADAGQALLGRVAPDPRWDEVGALDSNRIQRIGECWMLPSSHLLVQEGPDEAAHRIAREQIGFDLVRLPSPQVVSETYERPGATGSDPHWDLHFLYSVTGPPTFAPSVLWKELAYVSISRIPRAAIARDHGDILELAGLTPAP